MKEIAYDFDGTAETFVLCETPEEWKAARAKGVPQGRLWTPRMVRELKESGATKEEAAAVAHAKLESNAKDVKVRTDTGPLGSVYSGADEEYNRAVAEKPKSKSKPERSSARLFR